jgi:hypothetical protein
LADNFGTDPNNPPAYIQENMDFIKNTLKMRME